MSPYQGLPETAASSHSRDTLTWGSGHWADASWTPLHGNYLVQVWARKFCSHLTPLSKCLSALITCFFCLLCPGPLSVPWLTNSQSLSLSLSLCAGQPRASCVGGWVCLDPAPLMGGDCCLAALQPVPSQPLASAFPLDIFSSSVSGGERGGA